MNNQFETSQTLNTDRPLVNNDESPYLRTGTFNAAKKNQHRHTELLRLKGEKDLSLHERMVTSLKHEVPLNAESMEKINEVYNMKLDGMSKMKFSGPRSVVYTTN